MKLLLAKSSVYYGFGYSCRYPSDSFYPHHWRCVYVLYISGERTLHVVWGGGGLTLPFYYDKGR